MMMIRIITDAARGVLRVRQGGTENCALIISLNCWRHCDSCFTEGKTEAQSGEASCPLAPRMWVVQLGLAWTLSEFRAPVLYLSVTSSSEMLRKLPKLA